MRKIRTFEERIVDMIYHSDNRIRVICEWLQWYTADYDLSTLDEHDADTVIDSLQYRLSADWEIITDKVLFAMGITEAMPKLMFNGIGEMR